MVDKLDVVGHSLAVSHAFHSPLMRPIEAMFREVVAGIELSPNRIPLASTVTGAIAAASDVTDVEHWVRQLWSPVLYMEALEAALGSKAPGSTAPLVSALLEVGPNPVLTRMSRAWVSKRTERTPAWSSR